MPKAIPDGFHSITPYLIVNDLSELIHFIVPAFNANVTSQINDPDGKPMQIEVQVGDSMIMAAQARDGTPAIPCMLYVYVEDCDQVFNDAIAAGGEAVMEPDNMFYGDRHGGLKDPCGNQWWIATHVEDVSSEEIQRRMLEQMDA